MHVAHLHSITRTPQSWCFMPSSSSLSITWSQKGHRRGSQGALCYNEAAQTWGCPGQWVLSAHRCPGLLPWNCSAFNTLILWFCYGNDNFKDLWNTFTVILSLFWLEDSPIHTNLLIKDSLASPMIFLPTGTLFFAYSSWKFSRSLYMLPFSL